MTEAKKFDAALNRFERALGLVETGMTAKREALVKLAALETQNMALQTDRKKLDSDLAIVRVKAAELVDTSKQAAGKIDSAVSRIRSVLYSNSGA